MYTLYAFMAEPPSLVGGYHCIMTLSEDTVVVGASGAMGLKAQRTVNPLEKSEMPNEFLDCTLKVYVVPVERPVTVYEFVVTLDSTTL